MRLKPFQSQEIDTVEVVEMHRCVKFHAGYFRIRELRRKEFERKLILNKTEFEEVKHRLHLR